MNAQKRDKNEPDIIAFLNGAGAMVKQMDKSAGFDLLVVSRGVVYIAEVKNPENRWRLTQGEQITKSAVEASGGMYHILQSVDDAQRMIEKG